MDNSQRYLQEAKDSLQVITDACLSAGMFPMIIPDEHGKPMIMVNKLTGIETKRLNLRFPIDMILFCPMCHTQHVDAPEKFDPVAEGCQCRGPDQCEACYHNEAAYREWLAQEPWTNPPHRSHLCHACGFIWRPADVPTNGVAAVKTTGKADSPIAAPASPAAGAEIAALRAVLTKIVSKDDEWAAQMPVGEFDDPLSDAINEARDLLAATQPKEPAA